LNQIRIWPKGQQERALKLFFQGGRNDPPTPQGGLKRDVDFKSPLGDLGVRKQRNYKKL